MTRDDGIKIARQLKKHLEDKRYPIRQVLLFGSVAKESSTEHSDIDIAVVCEPFLSSKSDENGEFLWEGKKINIHIQTVCFHPKDLDDRFSTIAQEVKKYGITV